MKRPGRSANNCQRCGPPSQSLRDFAAGKPTVFLWTFGNSTLTHTTETLQGHTLSHGHAALLKKAMAHRDKAASAVRR